MFENDGANAITRVMEAYGFRFRNDLCRHVGMSSSTLATWQKRDSFPSDLVIRCALDTGVSMLWLTTGKGRMREHEKTDISTLPSCVFINGELKESGPIMFDKLYLPNNLISPFILRDSGNFYLLDKGISEYFDGQWMVEIEGKISLRDLAFIPVKMVKVMGGGIPFDCKIDDIRIIAKVISVTKKA